MMTDQDCFDEGFEDYGRGFAREDCPYAEGDDRRETWIDGWNEAEDAATNEEMTDNI